MKFVSALALSLVIAASCVSQTPDEIHAGVRAAVDEMRYADALNSLRTFEEKHAALFRANHYDYLAARLNEKAGNAATAAALYQSVVKRNSILKPHALFHLAAIARSSGNLVLERTYLDEIAAFSPASLFAQTAANRRARSWFDSGNYEQAAVAFRALAGIPGKASGVKGDDPVARENRLLLGRSLMLSGNTAGGREIFASLIGNLANPAQPDDFALAAAKGLDRLELEPGAGEKTVPKLSDYEHLRRASIYQFNRDFADARLHYAAIISSHPTSGIVPDAIYQTGRGYAQEANFSEAVKWFERTIEQFPAHPIGKDALLQAASAYARLEKLREAVRRYQDYISKYPGDDRLDRAYLNIIDILRDEGEEIEAQKWAVKVQEMFRGKRPEAKALFAEVRIHLARNDWDAALAGMEKLSALPDLGGVTVPGGTSKAEVTFLKAYSWEQKRSFPEAIDAYLAIPDGRAEYYGGRATERLQALALHQDAKSAVDNKLNFLRAYVETKNQEENRRVIQATLRLTTDPAQRARLLDSLQKIYSAIPAYRNLPVNKLISIGRTEPRKVSQHGENADIHRALADELAFLGLYDEAAPEFEVLQKSAVPPASDLAYTIAVMNRRGERAHRAVAFAEPLWRAVPADYQVELIPREQLELLYPAPYRDAFLKYALPRNVDPRFLLSVVRQESRYRPDIKSYAAARGMMQFISTTSEKIAAELGRTDFVQDELYDPSTAILFGSQYTANLFKLFPAQPEAVAASYNGGEDNMKRWMKRSKSDLADRYVPEIAFSQSKDYVYKVMANYRMYKVFYSDRLAPMASY